MHECSVEDADGLGIRRQLVNAEILKAHPQAVLVANHLSTLDIIVLGSFLTRDYRWLAKSELFKVPFSGWYLHMAGHIPVYRGKEARERNRIISERVHLVVENGASVLFFPEGTRSDTGQLNPFRPGAFRASIDENLPIIPLVIRGTHELMEKNAPDLAIRKDKSCSVTVLDPIFPETVGQGEPDERVARLTEITYAAFHEELGEVP